MRITQTLKASLSVIALLSVSLTLSCKHGQSGKSNIGEVHHGVGVVDSIDREMATLQINHEEIKDYMPAMSMPYPVKDKTLLDSVAPGDRVEFSLESTAKGDVVTSLKRVEPGTPRSH